MSTEGRVLCVDDHPLMRVGIVAVIQHEMDMEVAGEASTGREAIQLFQELQPHITLMDLRLPDISGIDALIAIRAQSPIS
jgi:DNA-binding NarL/FixJ family response regulator